MTYSTKFKMYSIMTYMYCKMIRSKLTSIMSYIDRYKKKKNKNDVFLVTRTFRIYSLSNFQIYHTAVITIVVMLYIHPQDLFIL